MGPCGTGYWFLEPLISYPVRRLVVPTWAWQQKRGYTDKEKAARNMYNKRDGKR
jgi:hypothetical protein